MDDLKTVDDPYVDLWYDLRSMENAFNHLLDPTWKLGDLDTDQLHAFSVLLKSLSPRSEKSLYLHHARQDYSFVLNAISSYSAPPADLRKGLRSLSDAPEFGPYRRSFDRELPRLASAIEKAAQRSPGRARGRLPGVTQKEKNFLRFVLGRLLAYVASNVPTSHPEIRVGFQSRR